MNAIHVHVLDHLTDKWEKKHMPYVEQKLSPQVTWEVLQGLHTPWISPKHVQACAWIFEPMHRPDHESRILYIDKQRLVGWSTPVFEIHPIAVQCCIVIVWHRLICYTIFAYVCIHQLKAFNGYVILICRINFALCTWSLSHALYLHPSPPLLQLLSMLCECNNFEPNSIINAGNVAVQVFIVGLAIWFVNECTFQMSLTKTYYSLL